jgi:hypothetical protein
VPALFRCGMVLWARGEEAHAKENIGTCGDVA